MTATAGSGTFRSLRAHRNYRLFFAGQVTSVCGTWMQTVALYWLVLSLTHSPLAVGVLSFARFGPFTLFGLFAGVVADRFDNRKTVIVTQSVQMAMSAVLAVLVLAGTVRTWELCVIAALSGTARRLRRPRPAEPHDPAGRTGGALQRRRAQLDALQHGPDRRPGARRCRDRELGAGWCFAINCASFLAVIGCLVAMRTSELFPLAGRGRPTMWNGTREGFAYVRRSRSLMVLIGMAALLMSISFNFNVLLPVLAERDARRRATDLRRSFSLFRRRCTGRRARLGDDGARAVAGTVRRLVRRGHRGARRRPAAQPRRDRRAARPVGRVLHDVHRELEHDDPAASPTTFAAACSGSTSTR